jgi:hypothetical protein
MTGRKIKLVNIKERFFNIFDFNTEIMTNDTNSKDRPFLLVVKLKYKGKKQPFAIPFRSNIQVNKSTNGTYFPLPNRYTTKPHHAHGLHYIKIFPVPIKYCDKFIVKDTDYNNMLIEYILKNIDEIIQGAQQYLIDYENGNREKFCTDIDRLLDTINKYELMQEDGQASEKIALDKIDDKEK